jgi:hypothetical protein
MCMNVFKVALKVSPQGIPQGIPQGSPQYMSKVYECVQGSPQGIPQYMSFVTASLSYRSRMCAGSCPRILANFSPLPLSRTSSASGSSPRPCFICRTCSAVEQAGFFTTLALMTDAGFCAIFLPDIALRYMVSRYVNGAHMLRANIDVTCYV